MAFTDLHEIVEMFATLSGVPDRKSFYGGGYRFIADKRHYDRQYRQAHLCEIRKRNRSWMSSRRKDPTYREAERIRDRDAKRAKRRKHG